MNWLISPLRKCFVFSGRASRKEYWMFVLCITMIYLVFGFLDDFLNMRIGGEPHSIAILSSTWAGVVILPSLSIGVRRLHDTNRSGWWLLIGLVPVFGGIVLFIYMVMNGTTGNNQFGLDPKFSN